MTKKTNDTAEAGTDTSNLAATLPASLVQSAATAAAATEATLQHPQTGGSYLRQADGSLVPNPDAATAAPAPEPKSHFDQSQDGAAAA